MFKKNDVKKLKDMPENNNNSSDEELSDDELFNVAGGAGFCRREGVQGKEYERWQHLMLKPKDSLSADEQKELEDKNIRIFGEAMMYCPMGAKRLKRAG